MTSGNALFVACGATKTPTAPIFLWRAILLALARYPAGPLDDAGGRCVYIPVHFKPDDADVRDLLCNHGAVDLITSTPSGLLATMLPMVYEEAGSRLDPAPHGVLLGHFARNNPHWREPALGQALAIARGPDAYITPSWYETKREHGRVVPTWNYITAHVYGELVIHDDPAWVEDNVRRLTAKHERHRRPAWAVDDAPQPFLAGQLRAIVGVELRITRIEAKFKLSQNRSAGDVDGVIDGLAAAGDLAMSTAVRDQARKAHS